LNASTFSAVPGSVPVVLRDNSSDGRWDECAHRSVLSDSPLIATRSGRSVNAALSAMP
jgi:hypothetical protein